MKKNGLNENMNFSYENLKTEVASQITIPIFRNRVIHRDTAKVYPSGAEASE